MAGFRLDQLGTKKLSWRDLFVLVRRWQSIPDTAFSEAVNGVRWTLMEQFAALTVDALHSANWQRAKKKSAPRPKPVPRPWDKGKSQSLGKDPIPVSQFNAWWDSQGK